jgi:hypothetical protein
MKNPTAGGAAGQDKTSSLPGRIDGHSNAPKIAPAQAQIERNPRAVREAKRLLQLEFLHECSVGIQVYAALAQTFAEIGDSAGIVYALRQIFAHVKAVHPIFLELREEAGK